MEFRTKIGLEETSLKIDYQSQLMMLGSCFAENIGDRLKSSNFEVNINPFGILYNPASIVQALQLILDGKRFTQNDLFFHQGHYHSYLHHSCFSDIDQTTCLHRMQSTLDQAATVLQSADLMQITFGTAHVFKLKESGRVVANCHKQSAHMFELSRLTVNSIVESWMSIIHRIKEINPSIKILFTVSPIRHWKDGAHGNQLSKSILLLAIDELQSLCPNVFYFPAYELVLDELRDYRFYAKDMIHPNEVAINYIWECFSQCYFSEQTQQAMKEWQSIQQALDHRPFNRESDEYQRFESQTHERLKSFETKWKKKN